MKMNTNFELLSNEEMLNIKGGDGCLSVGPAFTAQLGACNYIYDQMWSNLEDYDETALEVWSDEWDAWNCQDFFLCLAGQH